MTRAAGQLIGNVGDGSLCLSCEVMLKSAEGPAGTASSMSRQTDSACCICMLTGHADITKFEWLLNMHRDSYASYIGHHNMLSYFSVAQNESIGRVKYEFMQKMLLPCGLPPAEKDDE